MDSTPAPAPTATDPHPHSRAAGARPWLIALDCNSLLLRLAVAAVGTRSTGGRYHLLTRNFCRDDRP